MVYITQLGIKVIGCLSIIPSTTALRICCSIRSEPLVIIQSDIIALPVTPTPDWLDECHGQRDTVQSLWNLNVPSTSCLTEFRVKFHTEDIPIAVEVGNTNGECWHLSDQLLMIYHSTSSLIDNRSLIFDIRTVHITYVTKLTHCMVPQVHIPLP